MLYIFEKCPVYTGIFYYYNYNMRKIKIFITIFTLYEFVMLTILQIPKFCNAFFNNNFCYVGGFKYFLLCIMLPILIGLFVWWLPEIVRTLCSNKCNITKETDEKNKDTFNEIISKQDIENFITSAIITGIQKFAIKHPKTTEAFDGIIDILKNTNTKKNNRKKNT